MSTFLRKSLMIAVWGLTGLMMTAQSQTLPTGKNIATSSKWNGTDKSFVETPPPAGPVRSIAEFERSAGVLISYLLSSVHPDGVAHRAVQGRHRLHQCSD